jgi:hypothetical protein
MNSIPLTKTVLSVTVVAALAVAALFYTKYEHTSSRLETRYLQVRSGLIAAAADTERASAGESGEILFPDCAERGKYDEFLLKDSRAMTAAQLREAVRLHASCGKHFAATKRYSLQRMGNALAEAAGLSNIAAGAQGKRLARNAALWQTITDLEDEKTALFERQVAIQGSYWETELQGKTGIISATERERVFGDLNREAIESQQTMKELIEKLAKVKETESAAWEADK